MEATNQRKPTTDRCENCAAPWDRVTQPAERGGAVCERCAAAFGRFYEDADAADE